jgi:hypothetical protein
VDAAAVGIKPLELLEMTPREYANYSKGVQDIWAAEERVEWERIRWLGWVISNHLTGGYKTPKDLQKLPHEMLTKKEQEQKKEKLSSLFPKHR